MSRKIIGVTVGTSISPQSMLEKMGVGDHATKEWVQDGYQPKGDYLTEADKTEIAEMAAGLVKVPEPDTGGNVDLTGVVKSVNGQTPDENGNVEIETTPDELEQIALLAELDMLPAVHNMNGAILTDEKGNVILRY